MFSTLLILLYPRLLKSSLIGSSLYPLKLRIELLIVLEGSKFSCARFKMTLLISAGNAGMFTEIKLRIVIYVSPSRISHKKLKRLDLYVNNIII